MVRLCSATARQAVEAVGFAAGTLTPTEHPKEGLRSGFGRTDNGECIGKTTALIFHLRRARRFKTERLYLVQPANNSLRLGVLAIAVNVVLMIIKIGVGVVGHSYALVADGIESASDIFSSIVTWAGFRLSLKPPDEDHPYGHGKIDALTGMFSGACLFAAALLIAYESIIQIRTPHRLPAWFTLPVLFGVIAVKEFLSRRVFAAAADLDSSALKGDAWHHRSDAVISAAAAIGITIALIGGNGWESADDWGALAACTVIITNAFFVIRTSLYDATDHAVSRDLRDSIAATAAAQRGVLAIETCLVRKSGTSLFVELHVEVEAKTTIEDGHVIAHTVKAALKAENKRIEDVLVHLEPHTAKPHLPSP